MSCISSNFSSFFLDSLNDPSEFAKYLGNGENKMQSFDDFQVFGGGNINNGSGYGGSQMQYNNGSVIGNNTGVSYDHEIYNSSNSSNSTSDHLIQQPHQYAGGNNHHSNYNNHHNHHQQQQQQVFAGGIHPNRWNSAQQPHQQQQQQQQQHLATADNPHSLHLQQQQQQTQQQPQHLSQSTTTANGLSTGAAVATGNATSSSSVNNQHFDGSFEFLKYLRHTSEYSDDGSLGSTPSGTIINNSSNNCHNSLIDLDTSTSMKVAANGNRKTGIINQRSTLVDIDNFDHDSKHTIFDLQHQSAHSNSNSNESSSGDAAMAMSGAFASAHLNASNSNTSSSESGGGGGGVIGMNIGTIPGTIMNSSDNLTSNQNASKTLVNFSIKENFDVHPAHRVEEGIFQHMNKLPAKKKETLKQLGVRFTGQMTLADKSIVVENFIKFCQEYKITDHRPFLSLNQCGLNKPEQIKFARYLGQGLPSFTLFCVYSNFKNLFCTKRTETYIKDGYNLNYILDKTKRHLSCTTAGGTPMKSNHPQKTSITEFNSPY